MSAVDLLRFYEITTGEGEDANSESDDLDSRR